MFLPCCNGSAELTASNVCLSPQSRQEKMYEKWLYIKLFRYSGKDRGINILPVIYVTQIFQGVVYTRKIRAIRFVANS